MCAFAASTLSILQLRTSIEPSRPNTWRHSGRHDFIVMHASICASYCGRGARRCSVTSLLHGTQPAIASATPIDARKSLFSTPWPGAAAVPITLLYVASRGRNATPLGPENLVPTRRDPCRNLKVDRRSGCHTRSHRRGSGTDIHRKLAHTYM